jgi:hypothetical protein
VSHLWVASHQLTCGPIFSSAEKYASIEKDWPSPEMEFLYEGDRPPYTNHPPSDDPSVRASGHFNMSFGLPTLW